MSERGRAYVRYTCQAGHQKCPGLETDATADGNFRAPLQHSMPDVNALLRSLHEDRLRRRGATEAESPSAASLSCYKTAPLVVLDLDGTLLDTTNTGVRSGVPSFTFDGNCETRLRPGLGAFLGAVMPHFELAIFTAGNAGYAERMIDGIDAISPGFRSSLCCVFSRERVDFPWDRDLGRHRITKDLRCLARYCGRPLCRCLIVDDNPETYRLNQSNALPVPTYDGSGNDNILDWLREFLLSMPRLGVGVPLDVRGWPLAPRGAQPLLPDEDEIEPEGGCVLGSAPSTPEAVTPEFLPAFLPSPEEDEIFRLCL